MHLIISWPDRVSIEWRSPLGHEVHWGTKRRSVLREPRSIDAPPTVNPPTAGVERKENMTIQFDKPLRDHILNHMVQTVENAPYFDDPFPHFIASGFIPSDSYEQLLASFPTLEHYEAFSYEKHHTQDGESNRKRFCLEAQSIDRLEEEPRTFWYTLRHALGSRALKDAVFTKLAAGLALRYQVPEQQVRELPGFALPELFRETEGYSIKPHPDTRKKVVTMQFALAADDSQRLLGTEFYRRSVNPMAWLREPRGFDIVKQAPFLPNTVYAFSVLNTISLKSWHGKSTLAPQQGVRNSLLNIWYEKVENANPELAEECGLIGPSVAAA
ncbi:MAG: hypothetical protein ACF788_05295 [Novipirellula sp. JB048]